MSEQKVSLWEKWKVQFAFVAGALVVSSVWGTCSYAPSLSALEGKVEEAAPTELEGVEVDLLPTEEVTVTTTTEATTVEVSAAATETATEVTTPTTTVTPATTTTVTPTTE